MRHVDYLPIECLQKYHSGVPEQQYHVLLGYIDHSDINCRIHGYDIKMILFSVYVGKRVGSYGSGRYGEYAIDENGVFRYPRNTSNPNLNRFPNYITIHSDPECFEKFKIEITQK